MRTDAEVIRAYKKLLAEIIAKRQEDSRAENTVTHTGNQRRHADTTTNQNGEPYTC